MDWNCMLNGGKIDVFLHVIALAWVLSEMSAAPINCRVIVVISENGLYSMLGLLTMFIRGNIACISYALRKNPALPPK